MFHPKKYRDPNQVDPPRRQVPHEPPSGRNVRAFGQPGERHQGNTKNAGRCYYALLKPMLSGTTVAGPTGNNSAWSMLSLVKAIFSLHTFLSRSLKKPLLRNSPAQRRDPKPHCAVPPASYTVEGR